VRLHAGDSSVAELHLRVAVSPGASKTAGWGRLEPRRAPAGTPGEIDDHVGELSAPSEMPLIDSPGRLGVGKESYMAVHRAGIHANLGHPVHTA
jgi:hypothetical protein